MRTIISFRDRVGLPVVENTDRIINVNVRREVHRVTKDDLVLVEPVGMVIQGLIPYIYPPHYFSIVKEVI